MKDFWKKAEDVLKKDGVVILPTDTLYGIVGKAESKKAVERIHKLKDRNENKPFIILISSIKDLKIFGIQINKLEEKFLKKKVSIILKYRKFKYLHRGQNSLAFRMITKRNKNLFNLIKKVGPIVAPSANKEGEKPRETIKEAKEVFKDKIDLYINGGIRKSKPSTLIKIEKGEVVILRKGSVQIK